MIYKTLGILILVFLKAFPWGKVANRRFDGRVLSLLPRGEGVERSETDEGIFTIIFPSSVTVVTSSPPRGRLKKRLFKVVHKSKLLNIFANKPQVFAVYAKVYVHAF